MPDDGCVVAMPIGVLKELCAIGTAITTGYPYGVFRRQGRIGGVTITSKEEFVGCMVTEKQMYSLRRALHDVRPYLRRTNP